MENKNSVYKYRKASEESIEMIHNNELWAAKPDTLNDVFETLLMRTIENELCGHYLSKYETIKVFDENDELIDVGFNHNDKTFIEIELEKYIQALKAVGIYSLSYNKSQELLWGLYADGMKGFVIEYNKDDLLITNHSTSFDVHYYNSSFKNKADSLTDSLAQLLANSNTPIAQIKELLNFKTLWGEKVAAWKYEEEFRLIFNSHGNVKYNPDCIKAIYLGCKMGKESINLLVNSAPKHVKFYYSTPAIDQRTGMICFDESEKGRFNFNANRFPQVTI